MACPCCHHWNCFKRLTSASIACVLCGAIISGIAFGDEHLPHIPENLYNTQSPGQFVQTVATTSTASGYSTFVTGTSFHG